MDKLKIFGLRPRFHRREEFVVDVSGDGEEVQNLPVLLQYAEAEPGEIVAIVLGDLELAKELKRFLVAHPCSLSLSSTQSSEQRDGRFFRSDQACIQEIEMSAFSKHEGRAIAHLWLKDFVIRHSFDLTPECPNRQLSFFLSGPQPWMTFGTHSQSFTGEVKHEVGGSRIDLQTDIPLALSVSGILCKRPVHVI